MRTVRSFAQEDKEAARYSDKVHTTFRIGARKALAYGSFAGTIGTVAQYAVVLVLWYGSTLVIQGEFSSSKLTAFLLYTVLIATALGMLSELFNSIMSAIGASERIFALLDTAPGIPNKGGATAEGMRGVIELRNVSFSYPTRASVQVLSKVSLTIHPGTVVALCGPSGSGKSSIISLLERFYDPDAGAILVDGQPLAALDASWWRRQVALVAQEPVLFGCSVHDNITYGCAAATADAVILAARTANAHDFVSDFEHGYQTLVGERGVQLSGGQKQRIAIARALLVNPKVRPPLLVPKVLLYC